MQILRDAGVSVPQDESKPLNEIDPLTFMWMIFMHSSFKRVMPILAAVRERLGVTADLPTDLTSVLWLSKQASTE